MLRYAIYWAPEPGSALADFGRRWLGSDPERGEAPAERETLGLDTALVERATSAPRRYGLHATMKAPFRLEPDPQKWMPAWRKIPSPNKGAEPRSDLAGAKEAPSPGVSEAVLNDALRAFCAPRRAVSAGRLRLVRFGGWLALVPEAPLADLDWLAAQCVVHFDRFRAALSDDDRARRSGIADPLRQRYFEQFGYPDVLAAFTFHITLAGPLPAAELDTIETVLRPATAAFTQEPFRVRDLCWFGDPGGGRLFQIRGRFPLMS